MRKIISFILAVILSVSCIFTAITSYADDRAHIEDTLNALETQAGYIPFQYSSVQYNCFGFISDVCAKLYGVTYNNEIQSGNYRFVHTQNYFTVAQNTFPCTADTTTLSNYAQWLKDWLLANAAVGDVLQIGCANDGYSKKHTVLIQHIDEEKIMLYHANYATSGVSSAVCRLDTIYWNSFVSTPTTNTKDSLNYLLGSNFKLSGGLGISINRYSFLEQTYQLDTLSKYTAKITKTERSSSTAIKIYWNEVSDAAAYNLEYRAIDSTEWTTASNSITGLNYTVNNLTPGATYCFRVNAFVLGEWKDYSTEVTKSVQPPKPVNITADCSNWGITLSWANRNDITGVNVYRSLTQSGPYDLIMTVPKEAGNVFTDYNISNNQTYYYKIERYLEIGDIVYKSEMSPVASCAYPLGNVTYLNAVHDTKTGVKLTWDEAQNATSYAIGYREITGDNYTYISSFQTSARINNLKLGKTYQFVVCSVNSYGQGTPVFSKNITIKAKKTKIKVTKKNKRAKISWKKIKNVSGYKVYRSTSKNGKAKLIKTVKGNKTFNYTDKKVHKNRRYYYTVKAYQTQNKKQYLGYTSNKKSVKI